MGGFDAFDFMARRYGAFDDRCDLAIARSELFGSEQGLP
jgi:hypothetical protein